MCGYYNNMRFDSWRCEDDPTCWWYEWYGENDDGEVMMGTEPGLALAVKSLIEDIIKLKPDTPYIFYSMPVKYILDDERRNKSIEFERKRLEDIDIDSYICKDFYKWHKESNPCIGCKINKKDHWSDMHYNCEEGYNMRCAILKEWLDEVGRRSNECKAKFDSLTEEERKDILSKCRQNKNTNTTEYDEL